LGNAVSNRLKEKIAKQHHLEISKRDFFPQRLAKKLANVITVLVPIGFIKYSVEMPK